MGFGVDDYLIRGLMSFTSMRYRESMQRGCNKERRSLQLFSWTAVYSKEVYISFLYFEIEYRYVVLSRGTPHLVKIM